MFRSNWLFEQHRYSSKYKSRPSVYCSSTSSGRIDVGPTLLLGADPGGSLVQTTTRCSRLFSRGARTNFCTLILNRSDDFS
mmetsp:Transcript_4626/g.10654  ORF Transcript_4626/g.10654 Transcript_4626/m.10654 type:complete len:81 (+) Transcript_4626:431-673(+)